MDVVGTATNGRTALEMTLALEPDVLLIDIRMPGMDGFQTLAAIKSAKPDANVIMLTSYPKSEYLERAIFLGAAGFVSKADDPKHIPQAIRIVAAGDAIVNRELLQDVISEHTTHTPISTHEPDHALPDLTDQETRIIKMVAAGLNNDAITDALSVTRNTVKTHMRHIYTNLGVSDRTQAAIWAIRNGLAD
jgi:DNA-binding NarL/FixJ family response regulator